MLVRVLLRVDFDVVKAFIHLSHALVFEKLIYGELERL